MRKLLLATAFYATAAGATGGNRVAGSKHDLSVTGPGPYRAVSEQNPCVFCHIAHHSGEKLSNRPDIGSGHRTYESSTMSIRPDAPTGATRVCLSCHDGTIAPGSTRKGRIAMQTGDAPIGPERRSNLGTDLRGTHPVSFRPLRGTGVAPPPPADAVKLDKNGELQCTSCHDPHDQWGDPEIGKFLVKPSGASALCLTCHSPSGKGGVSSHATAKAPFTPVGAAAPTTVAQAGCGACHDSHGADPRGRLLRRGGATDDEECLRCHSGQVARADVGREIAKPWAHAARGRDHDAAEGDARSSRRLPEASPGAARHVTCVDCHDPHSATASPALAPAAGGALAGTWGIALDGRSVAEARFEYEVCLKCHGDSANKPQAAGVSRTDRVRRAQDDVNLRRVFDPGSPSFHPVAAPGKNPLVPGLRPPLTASSVIYCTDCHASDDGAAAGGAGPRGPHGSVYPQLLERQYATADFTPESPMAYALCYKCHDRETLLREDPGSPSASPFPHRKHVVNASAPCSACHDAHGISAGTGSETENARLVAFDLSIVSAGSAGPPRYAGTSARSCNLTCHGRPAQKRHDDNLKY
jgi:predicted CXXCH cytochrome family protein